MDFIINKDGTASANTPKPKGKMNAELRDKIKAWENRNRYEVDKKCQVGSVVEGELRNGKLYVE